MFDCTNCRLKYWIVSPNSLLTLLIHVWRSWTSICDLPRSLYHHASASALCSSILLYAYQSRDRQSGLYHMSCPIIVLMQWQERFSNSHLIGLDFLVSISDHNLLLSIIVVVVVNFSYIHLLLQNHWTNFNQTWHKASVGEGDSSLFKWRAPPFSKGR